MVLLDKDVVARKWLASNISIGERAELDLPFGEEAFIVFDDHGMVCIACDDSDPILVESVFNEQVWISTEGQMVLQELQEGKTHFTGLHSFEKYII